MSKDKPALDLVEFKAAPRTILHGPVSTFHSRYGKYPKYHLQRECMQRTQDELVEKQTYRDAFALIDDLTGRPCRACALERVLYTILRPVKGDEKVFVTFTSQGSPMDPTVNLFTYRWRDSTPSGNERLQRIAKRFKMGVGHSASGMFAYGFVSPLSAERLSRNLRTHVDTTVTELPERAFLECAWTLLADNPPELRALGVASDSPDPWEMARLLLRVNVSE